MDLLKSSTYFLSAAVCLMVAISFMVLLMTKKRATASHLVVRDFAVSALLSGFYVTIFLLFERLELPVWVIDDYVTPVAYLLQVFLGIDAIVAVVRFGRFVSNWRLILAILLFTIMYFGSLVVWCMSADDGVVLSGQNEATKYYGIASSIAYSYLVVALVAFVDKIFFGIKRVSGRLAKGSRRKELLFYRMVYLFLVYFALALLDVVVSNKTFEQFFVVSKMIVFVIGLLMLVVLVRTYNSNESPDEALPELSESEEPDDDGAGQAESGDDAFSETVVLSRIKNWESLPEKPFVKDGLLISDVASSLGVSVQQLSMVLNQSMKMNFNAWINALRVEEAKRIMRDDDMMSLSQISYMVGYSDVSVFSRNFKKVAGETPTAFRRKLPVRKRTD